MKTGWTKYVFLDESGDLGMHGSKYFTIAAVVVSEPKILGRIIKKARQRKLKKKLKQLPEVKANSSSEQVRRFVLKKISESDCQVFAIVIDKSKIFSHLYDVKNRLYNYFCGILLNKLKITSGKLVITIDKKHTNTFIRENFNEYITHKIKELAPDLKVEIYHGNSYSSSELQAIDFIAWSINRKFNSRDDSYFRIVEGKIVNKGEMELWK